MRIYIRNILSVLLLVVIGDLLFYFVIGHRTIPPEIFEIEALLEEGVDVVYFGDSTTIDIAPDDADIRSLPEMVDDALPEQRVGRIAHYAYHGEVYEGYSRVLAESDSPPVTAIIPISMRAFSPAWDLRPDWQFEKEKFLLQHRAMWSRIVLKPLTVFRYVDVAPISREEFEATVVYFGENAAGHVRDYEGSWDGESPEAYFQGQFIYRYAYPLSKEHRKLEALVRTVRNLHGAGIEPIVYITPLDHASGERWVGEEFLVQLEANVRLVMEVFAAEGVEVIDLSRSLGADAFCYEGEVHEHLDEGGREFVAEELVSALNAFL